MKTSLTIDSAIGLLTLEADGEALTGLRFTDTTCAYTDAILSASPVIQIAVSQLLEYFAGRRMEFDIPLVLEGTPFERQVWEELVRIPYGMTISYGELAQRLENPLAVRAVGRANGRNPISIIVPCHRVIGSDGKLAGYGGGIDRKMKLLDFESAVRATGPQPFLGVAQPV